MASIQSKNPLAPGVAVIFGAGAKAGLGAALARHFAAQGLALVISARSAERLATLAQGLRGEGALVEAVVGDASQAEDVAQVLEAAEAVAKKTGGALELVVFNAGANLALPTLELDERAFEELWRHNAKAGYIVGRASIQRLLPQGRGTLLFTGATASLRARPPFIGFAAAKAALRAVAQGLAREFSPAGIHVAHVVIDGVIDGARAREAAPGLVERKGPDGLIAPEAIAEIYWHLHRQPPSAWTHEIDLRPFGEPF